MARTRGSKNTTSAGSTASKASSAPAASTSRYILPAETSNPPKIFILPSKATADARVVSLLNPRYSKPTRYLACPETGIYEFTRIAAPKSTPRSWLVECRPGNVEEKGDGGATRPEEEFDAYVTKGAELHIATPVDPVFLILPALLSEEKDGRKGGKKMFLSSDDYFDSVTKETSPHFSEILRWGKIRQLLEARMAAVCDTVEAGDETMYRVSLEKLLEEMVSKARRMSQGSLPPSMEEKFVTKALEAPVIGLKREQSGVSSEPTDAAAVETTDATDADESTAAASALSASIQASPEVAQLQRLRTAFGFVCSGYIAPAQAAQLKQQLSENKAIVDFAPLDDYLAQLTKLRQEAVASRSMGDYSSKRMLDDEEVMERAEKKRKKDEEEKRQKAGESRGVKNLKKVNVTGMKKMSDFFKKK